MKICLVLLAAILALSHAQNQYRPFNYRNPAPVNAGNSGSYRPLNDGRYTPDSSGSYKKNDGKYYPDDAGKYVHKDDKYKHKDYSYQHQGDKFGNSGGGTGGSGGSGSGFGNGNNNSGNTGGIVNIGGAESGFGVKPSNGNKRPQPVNAIANGFSTGSGLGQGIRQEANNGHIPGLGQGQGAAYYGNHYDNRNYKIIRKIENVEQDGYHYLYETENGITGEEQGKLANVGTDQEGMKAHGFYTYTGPDNVVYTVRYTADENGFVPEGEHLPTPPPIPAAILRALEYQRSIGTL